SGLQHFLRKSLRPPTAALPIRAAADGGRGLQRNGCSVHLPTVALPIRAAADRGGVCERTVAASACRHLYYGYAQRLKKEVSTKELWQPPLTGRCIARNA